MSLLKSVLFGSEGSYNVFGTRVNFRKGGFNYSLDDLKGAGFISQIATGLMSSNVFRWLSQGGAHVFVHEMGHALACKLLTGKNAKVTCSPDICIGETTLPREVFKLAGWKQTVIDAAGPIADVAFCILKIVAARALRMKSNYSWPISLALGSGAVFWMIGELFYASVSTANKDNGDFGEIARRSNTHLAFASTAFVSEVALGMFLAFQLARNR